LPKLYNSQEYSINGPKSKKSTILIGVFHNLGKFFFIIDSFESGLFATAKPSANNPVNAIRNA
jgi:hypothetical protein